MHLMTFDPLLWPYLGFPIWATEQNHYDKKTNLKIFSRTRRLMWWPWNLVCSIGDVGPTKFVFFLQMMIIDLDLLNVQVKFAS